MKFITLDPRPVSLNSEIARLDELAKNHTLVGVEITVPALAEVLDLNIDPQHTGKQAELSAIEAVRMEGAALPKLRGETREYCFCTVRADLDSVGAMALMRVEWETPGWISFHLSSEQAERIRLVHESDIFARGSWRPSAVGGGENTALAAIARAVADFKTPLQDRVFMMREWLLSGVEPQGYREAYEKERAAILAAIESGEIRCEKRGLISLVQSRHRAGTSVGYADSPVVIAFNDAFTIRGGEPHGKYTICQYQTGYVNMEGVKQDLLKLEEGWGGSPTLLGSPQGVSSKLTLEEVYEVVCDHLLTRECTCGSGEPWASCGANTPHCG